MIVDQDHARQLKAEGLRCMSQQELITGTYGGVGVGGIKDPYSLIKAYQGLIWAY